MIIQIDDKTRIKVDSYQFTVQYKQKKINKLTNSQWASEWYCNKINSAIDRIVQDRIAKNKDVVPLMEFPKIWKMMTNEIINVIDKQYESKGN